MPSVKEISESEDLSKLVDESDEAHHSPGKNTPEKVESSSKESDCELGITEISQQTEARDETFPVSTAGSDVVAHTEMSAVSTEAVTFNQPALLEPVSTSEPTATSESNVSCKSAIVSETTVASELASEAKLTAPGETNISKSDDSGTSEKAESLSKESDCELVIAEVSQQTEASDRTISVSTAGSSVVAHTEMSVVSTEAVAFNQPALLESVSTSKTATSESNVSCKSAIVSETTVASVSASEAKLTTPGETNISKSDDSETSAKSELNAARDESTLAERILSSRPGEVIKSNKTFEVDIPDWTSATKRETSDETHVLNRSVVKVTARPELSGTRDEGPLVERILSSKPAVVPESNVASETDVVQSSILHKPAETVEEGVSDLSENLKPALEGKSSTATDKPGKVFAELYGTDVVRFPSLELKRVRAKCEDKMLRLVEKNKKDKEAKLFRGQIKKSLSISAENHTAKSLEPKVVTEKRFCILFDVSKFDKENLTVHIIGDKIDVHGEQDNKNGFGDEFYEIHQIFEIPDFVDDSRLTACITKNDMLCIEAPLKIKEEAECESI